jgi:hypothetical protein
VGGLTRLVLGGGISGRHRYRPVTQWMPRGGEAAALYASDVDVAVAALRASELPGTQNVWTLGKMASGQPPSE